MKVNIASIDQDLVCGILDDISNSMVAINKERIKPFLEAGLDVDVDIVVTTHSGVLFYLRVMSIDLNGNVPKVLAQRLSRSKRSLGKPAGSVKNYNPFLWDTIERVNDGH